MKKSILIICFSLFAIASSFASSGSIEFFHKEKVEILKPCTVEIKGDFDGVEVDLEVTVDASWIECTFFKRGVRKAIEKTLNE